MASDCWFSQNNVTITTIIRHDSKYDRLHLTSLIFMLYSVLLTLQRNTCLGRKYFPYIPLKWVRGCRMLMTCSEKRIIATPPSGSLPRPLVSQRASHKNNRNTNKNAFYSDILARFHIINTGSEMKKWTPGYVTSIWLIKNAWQGVTHYWLCSSQCCSSNNIVSMSAGWTGMSTTYLPCYEHVTWFGNKKL